jgi:proteic killer suppression protein
LLDATYSIKDLRVPTGKHLEKLVADRENQYSIRMNKKWRLCFIWTQNGAEGVELDDYH